MSDRAVSMPADVLLGRDDELASLRSALSDAQSGRGRLVVITGPPGIGKTRLAEEFARVAEHLGVPAYWTRCTDEAGAPPIWPLLRLLSLAGAGTRAVDEALGASPTTVEEGLSARFQLIDAVTTALLAGAPAGGAVMVLEDVHWADELSVRVLRHLAAAISSSRLLLVVTARNTAGLLAGVLDDAAGQRGVIALRLPTLSATEVVSYLHAVAGTALPADLLRAVQARTGGLPLLVRAAATVLSEAHRAGVPLDAAAGSELWRLMSDGTDVRRLVSTSLAQVDGPTRELVMTAAVLGEHIDPAELAVTAGVDIGAVHERLAAATAVHLVEVWTGPELGYRFGHALVRDAVAGQLTPGAAESIHRQAAEALEARTPGDAARTTRAAAHWLLAGTDPDTSMRAATAARSAAATASRRFAHEEAVVFLERAVRAADRAAADPAVLAETMTELAVAQYLSGAVTSATVSSEAAFELAVSAGRADLAAAAALVVHGIGQPDTSSVVLRLADAALAVEGLPAATAARLHARRAASLDALDRFLDVGPASELAMRLARQSDDDLALLDAAWARSSALTAADDMPERMRLGALVVDRARRAGQPILEIFGHTWQIDGHYAAADMAAVDRQMSKVAAIGERQALPLARWHALRLRASRAAFVGDFDRGLEISSEAGDLATRVLGIPSAAGLSWAYQAMVDIIRGTRTRPPAQVIAVLEQAPRTMIVRLSLALLLANDERPDEARRRYDDVLRRLDDEPRDIRWGGSLTIFCHLAAMFADSEGAARLYPLMLPWTMFEGSAGSATVAQAGSPHRVAAAMAALVGLRADAERHYRSAIAADAAMGARPMLALDRIGLAETVLTDESPAQWAEVAELLRLAAADARTLGLSGVSARCAQAMARLTALTDARRRATDPLTAREHEIAALVAQSLSNRQIADRLVLSERTVESHVRNILAKLGFSGRTEIVSWALRR